MDINASSQKLYFQILIVWSMTEPVIQPEPIPEDFYMFDITVV